MRLLKWFLKFFEAPAAVAVPRRVKFVEGTEMLCPRCDVVIAVANRDIYSNDIKFSSHWDIKDVKSFFSVKHCDYHLFDYEPGGRGILIMTPTGWVG